MWTIKNSNLSDANPGVWELSPNAEATIIPSFTPSRSPSTFPSVIQSLQPSKIPTNMPSLALRRIPSKIPSTKPSDNRYCNEEDITGKTLFASGAGYCFKIEVGVDGQIIGDKSDAECNNKSGNGIRFSNYHGFTTGNILTWTPQNGFSGTMIFLENISLTEPKLVINSLQAGIFDVTIEVPSCLMTDPAPSLLPTVTPTTFPSSTFCSADDVSGAEYFSSIAGYCFKIELIDNVGKLIGDDADPTCAIKSGTGITFSTFDGFDGDTEVWSTGTAGFSGTMDFKRDPTVTEPVLIDNGLNGNVFDVTLILPSCQ